MSPWRCRWYRRRLVDYGDGALPRAEEQRVEAHLRQCPACREESAALREIPTALRAAAAPNPGDEFWRLQREAVGRAIGNVPAPRPSWWRARWAEGWRLEWRCYPVAAAASVLVAIAVYHFAASPPATAPGASEEEFTGLDTDSLLSLRDLMQTLVPADEPVADVGDDALLATLPLGDFTGNVAVAAAPQASDLNESELEQLHTLVGDFG
jgi:hypothetical protein